MLLVLARLLALETPARLGVSDPAFARLERAVLRTPERGESIGESDATNGANEIGARSERD